MQSGDSNQQGFSLFELVVGMGITLTIMAIGAALLSSTFNIRGRENRRTEALAAAQHALNIMARDIANADRLPTWNPGDEFRPAREKHGVD